MTGVSLPLISFFGYGPYGDFPGLLKDLRDRGVGSIELRTVTPESRPADVYKAALCAWNAGFCITVHGSVRSGETAVPDVFAPLGEVLKDLRQERLNVTVHPVPGDNVAMLRNLSDYIRANGLPVTIALENERLLPDKTPGDSAALVLAAVEALNRPEVGICFDMGHWAWCHRDDPETLPPEAFLRRVIHTHIHGIWNGSTHYPLSCTLPLQRYVKALSQGYYGVWNIEHSPDRYRGRFDPAPALLGSVNILQAALPRYAFLYDDLRAHFMSRMESAFSALDLPGDNRTALISSTSYLFRTGGVKWAMDIAFRDAAFLCGCRSRAPELLKDFRFMVITHGHVDHFEPETVAALKDLPLIWVVPEFLTDYALYFGIPEERLRIARPGVPISLEGHTLLPFPGSHYRPGTQNGVPELGYKITTPDGTALVFPGDVRDYTPKNYGIGACDWVFGHVWLSDSNTDPEVCRQYAEKMADYLLNFGPGQVLLGHLYESGRTDEQMWRICHAGLVAEALRRRQPELQVNIPYAGDGYPLTKSEG